MKVEIEERSSVSRTIRLEVPADVVAQARTQALQGLGRRAKVPGFRPGHAPLSILEQRFGPEAEADVLRRLIPEHLGLAIREAGLEPVVTPVIEQVEHQKDGPLQVTATVEVHPRIPSIHYHGLRLERPAVNVSEEEEATALAALQEQHSHLETYGDEHPIQPGDFALIDVRGVAGGKTVTEGKDVLVEVGSGVLLPGLEDQLRGRTRGEVVQASATVPSDSQNAELAGREIAYTMTVREIKHKVTPPLDDELAKIVGVGETLEALKAKVGEELRARKQADAERVMKDTALTELLARHPFEVPPALVEQELSALVELAVHAQVQVAGRRQGFTPPTSAALEALRTEYEPVSRRRVQGAMLLEALADQERLEASQAELDAEVERLARQLRVAPARARQMVMERDGSLEPMRRRVCREKALDLVLTDAHNT